MKFPVLCSLDSYLLKTFLINEVLLCTYAQLVSVTFKRPVSWMEFTNPNQILNFYGQGKEKIIWGAGGDEQSTVQVAFLLF